MGCESNRQVGLPATLKAGVAQLVERQPSKLNVEEKTPLENRGAAVAEMVDQVTSCANKAAQQVMKDHKEAFEKLADNKVDT